MDAFWWSGAIMAVFAGWALSSYASNFAYRLPRGEHPFGREPYCGDCDAPLTPRDLFPILSILMADGKCRHCGAQIPLSYYLLELVFPVLFLAAYVQYGFGDLFLITSFAGAAAVVMMLMAVDDNFFSGRTAFFIAVLGVLARGSLSDALIAAFITFLIANGMARSAAKKQTFDITALPPSVWLAAVLGCWFPIVIIAMGAVLWLLLWIWLRALKSLPNPALSAPVISFGVTLVTLIFLLY